MTPREYLFGLERFGIKLGLDNIRHLLEAADNPHGQFPSVHVAGTNGKGSVVAMLDAIVRAAGYRVGRFTSPHLIDVTERFLIDGVPISDTDLDEAIEFFRAVAEPMEPPPTFFEMNTAIAFRRFAQSRVDLAIVEVGMGGRLDSTNVLAPLSTAITNIDLEHTRYLGDTLDKIAYEKAGIIKPATPVIVTEHKPPARDVILDRAAELGSTVRLLHRDFDFRTEGPAFDQQFTYESPLLLIGSTPLALAGVYQGENAAAAVALAETLMRPFPRIDAAAIRQGLQAARWPCRLETVLHSPRVIIDVAHNPAGARRLAAALERCVTILAVSSDKDAASMLAALAPITSCFLFSQFQGTRALPVDALCAAGAAYPHRRTGNLGEAIAVGLAMAGDSEPLLITGSVFTAGEARQILTQRHGAAPLQF